MARDVYATCKVKNRTEFIQLLELCTKWPDGRYKNIAKHVKNWQPIKTVYIKIKGVKSESQFDPEWNFQDCYITINVSLKEFYIFGKCERHIYKDIRRVSYSIMLLALTEGTHILPKQNERVTENETI